MNLIFILALLIPSPSHASLKSWIREFCVDHFVSDDPHQFDDDETGYLIERYKAYQKRYQRGELTQKEITLRWHLFLTLSERMIQPKELESNRREIMHLVGVGDQ